MLVYVHIHKLLTQINSASHTHTHTHTHMHTHAHTHTHTSLDFFTFNILIFDEASLATMDVLSFEIDSFDI